MPSTTSKSPPKRGYPPHETPTERQRQIIEARLDGLSMNEIGKRFDITRQRVLQILDRWQHLYPDLAEMRGTYACKACGRRLPLGTSRHHAREHTVALGYSTTIETELKYDYVVDAYLRGERIADISRAIRTKDDKPSTYGTIYQILRARGIEPNRGGGKYERTAEVRARLREGQRRRHSGITPRPHGWRADE